MKLGAKQFMRCRPFPSLWEGLGEGLRFARVIPSPRPSPKGRGRKTFVLATLLLLSTVAAAQIAQPREDPQYEQRMKDLTQQLRCLVCQNETLAESNADLAEDLRREIREQMKAGKSDQEILAFLTQRYGDFVLYNPPVKATTYVLWFGPFVLLIAVTFLLYRYVKRRRELIVEEPLTEDERRRAEELLKGDT